MDNHNLHIFKPIERESMPLNKACSKAWIKLSSNFTGKSHLLQNCFLPFVLERLTGKWGK